MGETTKGSMGLGLGNRSQTIHLINELGHYPHREVWKRFTRPDEAPQILVSFHGDTDASIGKGRRGCSGMVVFNL